MKVEESQVSFFLALFLAIISIREDERRKTMLSDQELQLENRRSALLKRMGSVGDLRRGSITADPQGARQDRY